MIFFPNFKCVPLCFGAIGTRRIFPCWDEPKFTAVFRISIYHNKNYIAESNMLLRKQYPETDMIWSVFHRTPKMPTYLVAVMLYNYHGRPYTEKIGNVWCRKLSKQYTQFGRDVARNVREHFYYQVAMKNLIYVPTVKHVLIPDYYQYDDIDNNWRLVFYRETDFIYDKKIDPVAHKRKIAYLVARKMAHQWFCNLVSPSWWSDLWLNEGVATIFAIDAIDKVVVNSQMLDLFVVQIQHESLYMDSTLDPFMLPLTLKINKISEINSLSPSRYIKAPAIMRMLQYILTTKVFHRGFDIYLHDHMFQSATLDDFWTAMQTALDESSFKKYSFNVSERMDAWIKHRYYPVVNVIQESPKLVTVSLAKSYMRFWWIPVSITTQTKCNFDETFLLRGQWIKSHSFNCTFSLPYEEDGWIIANLKQTGYYRVNYDFKNWQKIADYLNTPKYSKIHVLNRAQIIDDAFHFMITKHLHPTIFWKLADYLSREKEYIAWYPMIKAMERMSSIFSLPEGRTILIKRRIMNILDDLLTEINYMEDSDDSDNMKSLRQESAKWACILDVRECIAIAKQILDQHLLNPKEHKILPSWKKWIYCNGIKEANDAIWTKAFRLWLTTHDDNILKSLICSEKYEIIYVFLSILDKDHSVLELRIRDRINLYFIIIAKHIKKNEVLEDIMNKFQIFKPREVSTQSALTYIINHVNCKEHFDKISTFVTENVRGLNPYILRKIEMRQFQVNKQIYYLHKIE